MRLTFPRLPDHERGYALVERDDGVVYRRYGGTAGPRLPHDIVRLVVERELRIHDGIWGGIAAGVDLAAAPGQRTELLADLVSSAATLDRLTPAAIRRLAAAKRAVTVRLDAAVDPAAIAVAATALQVEAARWARRGSARSSATSGLATTAAAALVQQAFRLPGVDRVEIVHDELNVASGGVPRKLGFTEVERRALAEPPPEGTGVGVVWCQVR